MKEKVYGITMVKDESDIIDPIVRNMISQHCDGVLIYDNMSVDGTSQILSNLAKEFPGIVYVFKDTEVGYYQSKKMTKLAEIAVSDFNAKWIVPFDADELFFSPYGLVADVIQDIEESIVVAKVWHMVSDLDETDNPIEDIKYRLVEAERVPVVIFRWSPGCIIAQGNHNVLQHSGKIRRDDLIQVKHYQYRSLKQFTSKVRNGKAAYDATNLDYGIGTHWRVYGSLNDEELKKVWEEMKAAPKIYANFCSYNQEDQKN